MKIARPVMLAVVLFGIFFYATTIHHLPFEVPSVFRAANERAGKIEITQAAEQPSFDSEEQNNINVYKRVLPSVVNITSTAVAWDFFYGAVPQEGQGSGFIIDREGHILTNNHVVENARQVE